MFRNSRLASVMFGSPSRPVESSLRCRSQGNDTFVHEGAWQHRSTALPSDRVSPEGVAMMSNCSLYPTKPIDPAIDPAYADGPAPPAHRVNHAGEIEIDWPVSLIPSRLNRFRTISFETLEDQLERDAEREEHLG